MCRFAESVVELFHNSSFTPFSSTGDLSVASTMVWSLIITKLGIDNVSNFFLVQLSCSLARDFARTTRTVNNPNCPVPQVTIALFVGRHVAHLEIFHVAHVVNHFFQLFAEKMIIHLVDQFPDQLHSSTVFLFDCCVGVFVEFCNPL